jgi:hypothetical protein
MSQNIVHHFRRQTAFVCNYITALHILRAFSLQVRVYKRSNSVLRHDFANLRLYNT